MSTGSLGLRPPGAGRGVHRDRTVRPGALGRLSAAGYVSLLTAQAVPLAVGLLVTLVSAALLGPAGRGTLTVLLTGATLTGALAFGSLHVPVVVGLRVGDRESLRHGVRLVGGLWAALTLAGGGLVLLGQGHDAPGRVGATELGWALAGGGLVVGQLFGARVLQGLGEHRGYRRAVVLQSVAYAGLAGLALAVARSPWLVFAGWYVAVGTGLLVAARALRRRVAALPPPVAPGLTGRGYLRSALANNVGSVGQMIVLRGDVLVVGLLLGAVDVGVYGMALSLTELTLVLPEVLALAVFGNRAVRDAAQWRAEVHRAVRWHAGLALVSALAVLLVAVLLARGPLADYRGLVTLVAIVLPGAALAGYTRIALSALQAQGAGPAVWRFGVLSLVLAVGYVPATLLGGTVGTAVMSAVAYGVGALHLHRALRTALGTVPGTVPVTVPATGLPGGPG